MREHYKVVMCDEYGLCDELEYFTSLEDAEEYCILLNEGNEDDVYYAVEQI